MVFGIHGIFFEKIFPIFGILHQTIIIISPNAIWGVPGGSKSGPNEVPRSSRGRLWRPPTGWLEETSTRSEPAGRLAGQLQRTSTGSEPTGWPAGWLEETSTRSELPGRLAGRLERTSTRSEPAGRLAGLLERTSTRSEPTGRPASGLEETSGWSERRPRRRLAGEDKH